MTHKNADEARVAYAEFIRVAAGKLLGINLSEEIKWKFLKHSQYLGGFIDYEDLGANVLLECQERTSLSLKTDERDIERILDKIRHRFTRILNKKHQEYQEILDPERPESIDPIKHSHLKEMLSKLSEEDLLIINLVIENNVEYAAKETKKSVATIYRRLNVIKKLLIGDAWE